ncbi:hypothetical protein [Streptomyces violascens]|uniref:hypothetical protein n=1 Tax=Streptomyces violascens TaxID=67381 RepID=UPI0036D04D18
MTDLPDRLCTALTERFTELGNPFSEMRRHERGPDGWPASHPVGPHGVAEVLRELLAAPTTDQDDAVMAVLPAPVDRAAVLREAAELDREGAELVCVDECGSCDSCGMEPFDTPAEGWREAARFLRRTPRDSADFLAAIRGARLIETELRRMADEAQQPTP